MNSNPPLIAAAHRNAKEAAAWWGLSVLLLAVAMVIGCWVVGTRSFGMGADTETYAGFFLRLGQGVVETRLEPGFVYTSYLLRQLGFGIDGYQAALFLLLLSTVVVSTRIYVKYLGDTRGYVTYLGASLTLLYLSPMFVNASINAIRQGLSSLLVFTALLSFQQRRWWRFLVFGALATSFHLSSLLFLLFAPVLLFGRRSQLYIAGFAFLLYCSGVSMTLVRALIPALYDFVMSYTVNQDYRIGVRLDFAVFSVFWYVLMRLAAPLVKAEHREKIMDSTAIYVVLLLPFFAVGWGYYSNRYLLPAWLSISLVLAAIACYSRIAFLRNPLLIHAGLLAASLVFCFYVTHVVII